MSTKSGEKPEYEQVDLTNKRINAKLAQVLPSNLVEKYNAVCFSKSAKFIKMAIADTTNHHAKDDICMLLEAGQTKVAFFQAEVAQITEFRAKQVTAWKKANPGKKIDGLNLPNNPAQTEDGFVDAFPGFESKDGGKMQHNPATGLLRRVDKDGMAQEPFGTFTSLPRQDDDRAVVVTVNQIIISAIEEGITEVFVSTWKNQIVIRYQKNGCIFEGGPTKMASLLPRFVFKPLMKRFREMAKVESTTESAHAHGSFKVRYDAKDYPIDFEFLPTQGPEVCVIKIQYEKQAELDLFATMSAEDKAILARAMTQPGIIACIAETPQRAQKILRVVCKHFIPEDFQGALIGPVPYGFNIISNMHVISAGDYANLASIITSWAPVVNLLAVDMALDFDSAYTVVSHSRKIPVVVWGTDDELLKIKFSTPNNDLVGSGLLNAMLVVENQHLTVRAL